MKIFSQTQKGEEQWEHDAENINRTSAEGIALNRFRITGIAVLIILRLRSDRVRRQSSTEIAKLSLQYDKEQSKEMQTFQGEVLSSPILMLRSAEAQACMSDVIKDPERLGVAVTALHAVKLHTIRTCWINHIRPWERKKDKLKIECDSLRKQFQECRVSYLREVAMLRDQVRVRPDPNAGLPALDITSYWSPEHMLSDEELEFMQNVISEKLKMIFDTNPSVTKTIDFGQVQNLKDRAENAEISALKQQLLETKRKARDEREDLDRLGEEDPRALEALRRRKSMKVGSGHCKSKGGSNDALENTADCELQQALNAELTRSRQLGRSLEAAKLELEEMRTYFEGRLKEDRTELESRLQDSLAKLDEQVRMHSSSLEELGKVKLELSRASAENSELQRPLQQGEHAMEKTAARQRLAARTARATSGIAMTACFDCGATSPKECSCIQVATEPLMPLFVDACVGTELDVGLRTTQGAVQQQRELMHRPKLDDPDVIKLEGVIQHQRELLQAILRAGTSEEEESRSAQPRGPPLSQASVLSQAFCSCGRLLRPEACEVCGQTRDADDESEAKARRMVESLSAKIASSESELVALQELLEMELDSVEAGDAEQPERVVKLQQRLLGLLQEKGHLEAQLLIANFVLVSVSSKPSSKDACCDCHQELQALRQLSSELALKLEQATEENRQKQSSMNDIQSSVKEIAGIISVEAPQLDGCMGKLQQVHETCVFDRLRSHSKHPSFIKKVVRMQRLVEESRAACAKHCVLSNRPQAPSQVMWSFAKARSEDGDQVVVAGNKVLKSMEVTGLGVHAPLSTNEVLEARARPPPLPVTSRSFPSSPRRGRLLLPTLGTTELDRAMAQQLEPIRRNQDCAPSEPISPVSPTQTSAALPPMRPQKTPRSMATRSGRSLTSARGSSSFGGGVHGIDHKSPSRVNVIDCK